jgi:hypothetical protein
MYIIINRTKNSKIIVKGNWPLELIDASLNNKESVIVVSPDANTVYIPYITGHRVLTEKQYAHSDTHKIDWACRQYNLPTTTFQYFLESVIDPSESYHVIEE